MNTLKEAGCTIKDACSVLGIARSGYYGGKHPKSGEKTHASIKDVELLEKIQEIKLNPSVLGIQESKGMACS